MLMVFLTTGIQAQTEEKTLSLTLEDCILKALEHNLNVAINVLTPQSSEVSLVASREKWLPNLSFSYGYRDTSQASYSFLDAADQVNTQSSTYAADFSQLLPTGGTLTLSLDGDKSDSNRSFQSRHRSLPLEEGSMPNRRAYPRQDLWLKP